MSWYGAERDLHDNVLPPALAGSCVLETWTATNFETYFMQRLSSAVNMASAHEIRNQISRGNRLPTAKPRGGKRYRSCVRAGQ